MALFGENLLEVKPKYLEFSIKELHLKNSALATFSNLRQSFDYSCILESATGAERLAELSIIVFDPSCVFTASGSRVKIEDRRNHATIKLSCSDPLLEVRRLIRQTPVKNADFRFIGGAVGYFGYDAVRYWEKKLSKGREQKTRFPEAQFCFYEEGVIYAHQKRKAYYFHSDRTRDRQREIMEIA